MKRLILLLLMTGMACDTGNLTIIADLPKTLSEVSGAECIDGCSQIWMLNDSGNKPRLYKLDTLGKIKFELKIDAKNRDWEDLAADPDGNLYIGDFGNNLSKRDNLSILKINGEYLEAMTDVPVERISFSYPNQKNYPPKKKQLYFDSEALVFFNDSLYIFTKSRVRGNFGRTDLYKVPAERGQHSAVYIDSFTSCDDSECWITGADLSPDGKTLVLLSPKSAWLFSEFSGDNFFNGKVTELPFNHVSQKEGVCFRSENEIFIVDERAHGSGGNLYLFQLN